MGTLVSTFSWCEYKITEPLWKTIGQFYIELNIYLPYDPVIPFIDIYPGKMKTYIHMKTYTQMFIAKSNVYQLVNWQINCGASVHCDITRQ